MNAPLEDGPTWRPRNVDARDQSVAQGVHDHGRFGEPYPERGVRMGVLMQSVQHAERMTRLGAAPKRLRVMTAGSMRRNHSWVVR